MSLQGERIFLSNSLFLQENILSFRSLVHHAFLQEVKVFLQGLDRKS